MYVLYYIFVYFNHWFLRFQKSNALVGLEDGIEEDTFLVFCGLSFMTQKLSVLMHAESRIQLTSMMTSSNGNIFRVTGHLCGEFTGPGEFPAQMPVTRGFGAFFDLRLNNRLSKPSWGWWFETLSRSFCRHCNALKYFTRRYANFLLLLYNVPYIMPIHWTFTT